MTTRQKTTAIVEAVVGATVNLKIGDGHVPSVAYPSWYAPQVGDTVVVDWLADQPFVETCFTPNRLATGVSILNAAPGAGWDQLATGYSPTGSSANAPIAFVRNTPVVGPTSITVNPTDARSWSPAFSTWRTNDNKVRQGANGSDTPNYGCWFYGSGAFSGLTGHTVTGITMTVVRDSVVGGGTGPIQLHMFTHTLTTVPGSGPPTPSNRYDPSGATPSLGATVAFSLPLAYAQALQSGSAAGVGIADAAAATYLQCLGPANPANGSGRLVITYV